MTPQLELTFLGTGTSHGIPMIACDCPVCRSDDPRDKRLRSSAAVRLPARDGLGERVILIDVSPEFRLAAVAHRLDRVDAIVLTHAHADHIMGLDDIRRYNDRQRGAIPCLALQDALDKARRCFAHADRPYQGDGWPSLDFRTIDRPFDLCGVTVTPIPLLHGSEAVLGYRIGKLAYCTDCSEIPPQSLELLRDLDVLVLDGLRYTPHPTHFNIAQALETIARLAPRRAYLTHMAHEILHARTSAELPEGVALAFDGLRVQASL